MDFAKRIISRSPVPDAVPGMAGSWVVCGRRVVGVQMLGEGAFSFVYRVRDNTGAEFALKIVRLQDYNHAVAVEQEASLMMRLRDHPNVVRLVDVEIPEGKNVSGKEAFLLMELCPESLLHLMNRQTEHKLSTETICWIFRDVCAAVVAMHSQHPPIIHRDLKVENVLQHPSGRWQLCDFGSAIPVASRPPKGRQEISTCEEDIEKNTTPAYRAPEMVDLWSEQLISTPVDVWALGCLLYKLCYYVTPFERDGRVTSLAVLNGKYVVPVVPVYPSALTELLNLLLRLNPNERITAQQAMEIAERLWKGDMNSWGSLQPQQEKQEGSWADFGEAKTEAPAWATSEPEKSDDAERKVEWTPFESKTAEQTEVEPWAAFVSPPAQPFEPPKKPQPTWHTKRREPLRTQYADVPSLLDGDIATRPVVNMEFDPLKASLAPPSISRRGVSAPPSTGAWVNFE